MTPAPAIKTPGLVAVRGDRRTALCDVDRPHPPRLATIARVLAQLGILEHAAAVAYSRSSSGRGWHVLIKFRRSFTSGELVALQLAIGSDPKRERYNLRRVICGAPPREWNLFFSEKLT